MKKICMLLLASIAVIAFLSPVKAQDATKELAGFTKKFQDAYNKKDEKALKTFYTADASRTDATGSVVTGNENIVAEFASIWSANNVAITIKQEKIEKQADGSIIATGTYHVTGSSNAGEKLDINGSYTNTVVKESGKWKISKSVLASL